MIVAAAIRITGNSVLSIPSAMPSVTPTAGPDWFIFARSFVGLKLDDV